MAKKPFPTIHIPPSQSGQSGLKSAVAPVANPKQPGRIDQGVDYSQTDPYVAVGKGTVVRLSDGFAGHGQAVYYKLDTPITVNGRTYSVLYIAGPPGTKALVGKNDPVVAGQSLVPAGSAELGFAKDDASAPAAPLVGGTGAGTQATQAGADFYTFATGAHIPLTAQQTIDKQIADLKTQLQHPELANLQAAAADARARARAASHTGPDAWVVVEKDKSGNPVGIRYQSGFNPPKPTKTSEPLIVYGQPATQQLLNDVWGANYANTYEQFSGGGKVPGAAEIVHVLQSGLSPWGYQAYLAKQPGFEQSPVYKAKAAGVVETARQLLGKAPDPAFVNRALGESWDSATLQANIQKLPAYQQGPVFKQQVGSLTGLYKSIYGQTTPEITADIRDKALDGWTAPTFGNYLRSQPQYKTSPEYRQSVLSFLDGMGMTLGSRPVLKLDAKGQLVPSLPAVPKINAAALTPAQVNPPTALPAKVPV